jgi:hypothetical protein
MRTDVATAIGKAPQHVQLQVGNACEASMEFLNRYLPQSEPVEWITTAAPSPHRTPVQNSLLVLTDRRLLFIAPAPQVLSWKLPAITRVQALSGAAGRTEIFFIDDTSGGEYQLGADAEWGPEFESQVKIAIAQAVLRGE